MWWKMATVATVLGAIALTLWVTVVVGVINGPTGVLAAATLTVLAGLGRPAEALPVALEAVAIRRELATAHPDRYRSELAASLANLGLWLSRLGRPAEALPVTQEAVEAFRELAAADPDRYRPDLARSLGVLALALDALGQAAEAETARREANRPVQ